MRGNASVRFTCTFGQHALVLHIAGPGTRRESRSFPSIAELSLFQIVAAADLRAHGWELATGAAERRDAARVLQVLRERRVS
jgi:hypothetical protein